MDEATMVHKVLENYEFKINDFEKVRSAYKIHADNGVYCLKRIKHGRNKARNGEKLVQMLREAGFNNTARYYRTCNGLYFVKHKNFLFYLTDWIEGKECDLDDVDEVCNCVKLLAEFHLATGNIDKRELKIRNNIKNWPKIFSSNQYDMESFKKKIEKKKLKTEFDDLYYRHADSFLKRGMVALNFLNTSHYYRIAREADKKRTICHDSFYYQNLIKKQDEYYIIDLDSIIYNLHVNDLGKLIRRLMFKSSYQWDFQYARLIIEAYNSVNKLSREELEVMLALIVYPHKFWKLGKKRYIKSKNWDETKYLHKLSKLIKYDEQEQKFMENYLVFLEGYK